MLEVEQALPARSKFDDDGVQTALLLSVSVLMLPEAVPRTIVTVD